MEKLGSGLKKVINLQESEQLQSQERNQKNFWMRW